jgi:2,4-dienoyl-CoA reductase-like NADH-dependent reductase (Old Yellow Enzyme family)
LANNPVQLEAFLTPLADAGVNVFHASTRQFWLPEFEHSRLNLAGWTKKLVGLPTITVGSVALEQDFWQKAEPTQRLAEMLEEKEVDLVAIGRSLLANPQWVNQVKEGRFSDWNTFDNSILKQLN